MGRAAATDGMMLRAGQPLRRREIDAPSMPETSLLHLLQGPLRFLRAEPEELRLLQAGIKKGLPAPQRIFLTDEDATPVVGFPVLQSEPLAALRDAFEAWVRTEEEHELALAVGHSPDRRKSDAAWEPYRQLLAEATEYTVTSSFGRRYPSIFWLFHSIAVSRVFKESPLRLRRQQLSVGKAKGDEIKYRIFNRYLDRVLATTYDVVNRAAGVNEEEEKELFPAVLGMMRDNVLILTEDHVSPDLAELGSYFSGYLRLDGREFRSRFQALVEWNATELERDPNLRSSIGKLLDLPGASDPWELMTRRGYVSFLAERPGYDAERLLPPAWFPVWESLLVKLKEFELLASLRRFVIPIREKEGRLICSAAALRVSLPNRTEIDLSNSTRPLEFMKPWVVDPVVRRFGLVYDITDFSAIISVLRRSGADLQDASFRQIFAFQRRINRMAHSHRLQLEKYLGDGALYSGRHPNRMLAAALLLQRLYRGALDDGFPFDRGMRMALNFGQYRLLPIESGGEGGQRYEFFGHGIVELSRLVTGKTTREIEEIKTLLVSRGYDSGEVERFFAPVTRQNVYLVDRAEEARPFYAYINSSGALVNEGIVATAGFISQIDELICFSSLVRLEIGGRRHAAYLFEEASDRLLVGFRKLGVASLKGLGKVDIFEVIDGGDPEVGGLEPLPERSLLEALEKDFIAGTVARSSR